MKFAIRAATAAGIVIGLAMSLAAPPVQAAQSGGFAVGSVSGAGVTRTHFVTVDKCGGNPAASPVKGVDATIFNVSGFPAGYHLTIRWTGQVLPTGTLIASFYSSRCDRVLPLSTSGGTSPSVPYRVQVPPGVKWIIIDGAMVANVSLSMT